MIRRVTAILHRDPDGELLVTEFAREALIPSETRHLRLDDQLVLGKWTRHAVAWTLQGVGRSRTPSGFLRAGRAVLCSGPRLDGDPWRQADSVSELGSHTEVRSSRTCQCGCRDRYVVLS